MLTPPNEGGDSADNLGMLDNTRLAVRASIARGARRLAETIEPPELRVAPDLLRPDFDNVPRFDVRPSGLVVLRSVGRGAAAPSGEAVANAASAWRAPTSRTVGFRFLTRGVSVRALQLRLTALGFDPGPADGAFGRRTQGAIVAFQRAYNNRVGASERIGVDGIVGRQTWRALERYPNVAAPTPPPPPAGDFRAPNVLLRSGSRGQHVVTLQRRLADLGFSPGAIDGAYGRQTRTAVIRFQNAFNARVPRGERIAADGIVGRQTWRALERYPSIVIPPVRPEPPPRLPRLDINLYEIPGQLLRSGSVRTLQNRLRDLGFLEPREVDGVFGPRTKGAVAAFQRSRGRRGTGIVGIRTWAALGGPNNRGLGAIYAGRAQRLNAYTPAEAIRYVTPNVRARGGANNIEGIVLHHTATPHGSTAGVLRGFSARGGLSSDFVVSEDGTIYQAASRAGEDRVASLGRWRTAHAGIASSFQAPGRPRRRNGELNTHTIGIEIVNRGDSREPYPEAQMIAVTRLTRYLAQQFGIPEAAIDTHRGVAPTRKIDPSNNFPMEAYRDAHRTGVWNPRGV